MNDHEQCIIGVIVCGSKKGRMRCRNAGSSVDATMRCKPSVPTRRYCTIVVPPSVRSRGATGRRTNWRPTRCSCLSPRSTGVRQSGKTAYTARSSLPAGLGC